MGDGWRKGGGDGREEVRMVDGGEDGGQAGRMVDRSGGW